MCCMWLAGNTGCKNDAKNRHLCTIAQLCWAMSSPLRHVSTIRQNLLNSNISHMSSQYGELQPTNAWDWFGSLGHPSKFHRVARLGFITAAMSLLLQSNQTLHSVWPSSGLVHYIYIFGAGRPSRWASAHILVSSYFLLVRLYSSL